MDQTVLTRCLGYLTCLAVAGMVLLMLSPVRAQWSASPGVTARNLFGPSGTDCRGACGAGCVSTCKHEVRYTCVDPTRLQRTRIYECGTHQGCRLHDDCLDRCAQRNAQGIDCNAVCHVEAVEAFGLENATSWMQGGGPYDPQPITFEYTRDAPGAPEPVYRCAEGTQLTCGGETARCLTAGGVEVEPVFDAFPPAGTLVVSSVRSGRLCSGASGAGICEEAVEIPVTGTDSCDLGSGGERCTRFGFEFDYRGANPSVPLACSSTSSDGQNDFMGGLVAQGLSAIPAQELGPDFGALLGSLQGALREGNSLTDVFSGLTVTPGGRSGAPVPPARAGGAPPPPPPPVPRRVTFESARGRLVVPMYARHEPARAGQAVVREVKCSYSGSPVVETRFRLRY